MAFDETRLPDDIERGARGGPTFNTQIVTLSNGFEERNGQWSRARLDFDIGYGIQDRAGFQEVLQFFYARRGRLRGFRFKDWGDYQGTTEAIGTGTGSQTEFQLQKAYTNGGQTYTRIIQKPVSGSVTVFVNGVEDGSAVVDTTTGVVTPSSTPANGQPVTATFEFDVPVRFESDSLRVQLELFNAGAIPEIPLSEILIPVATLAGA